MITIVAKSIKDLLQTIKSNLKSINLLKCMFNVLLNFKVLILNKRFGEYYRKNMTISNKRSLSLNTKTINHIRIITF